KPRRDDADPNESGLVQYGLTRRDFERLTETIPTIDKALPVRELRREFRHGAHLVDGRFVGCTPEYANVVHLEMERGRFLTDADLEFKRNVCVLAADVAERLFPIDDAIGRSIRVENLYYVVVGI